MANGKHKQRCERFKTQVLRLGGEKPIVEWTAKSGLIGFEYNGNIHHKTIAGAKSEAEMDRKMGRECKLAIDLLKSLVGRG